MSLVLFLFRDELWVVPVVVASACLTLIILVFEAYLIVQTVGERRKHRPASRRHLFLGQTLLLGLLACTAMAAVYALRPTVVVCSLLR